MSGSAGVAERVYKEWLNDPLMDEDSKRKLREMAGDVREIEDCFYRHLQFGTGGLRGIIGVGTNRMNRYTVGMTTQGLAAYVMDRAGGQGKASVGGHDHTHASVVIAYDSRHYSPEFALEAALVLAGNGIRVYVFKELRPTPELSFAVRELRADAGIVVTASHNPPEYNGYKVYGPDGGQLVPDDAERVIRQIAAVTSMHDIRRMDRREAEEKGLLVWLDASLDEKFIDAVTAVSFRHQTDGAAERSGMKAVEGGQEEIRVVFTPLHGTGNKPVRAALRAIGIEQVDVVAEQEQPDADFSTVKSPNPEEREAFTLALALAAERGADLIIGTDPDADRMGAAVKDANGQYVLLSGNQSGALIVYYLLEQMKRLGRLPNNGVVIKTIVTSEFGAKVAESFGMQVMNTLTGFKYIGQKMSEFARTGTHQFVFGYEESYGYLAGNYARDKDAVLASMLICEAAAFYKAEGKTLVDVLEALYQRFGYYIEKLESRTLTGKSGLEQITAMMRDWRKDPPDRIAGLRVARVLDYEGGIDGLPPENVLKFFLEDGSWFCLRPSGTEPKIKVYFSVCQASQALADQVISALSAAVMARVDAG